MSPNLSWVPWVNIIKDGLCWASTAWSLLSGLWQLSGKNMFLHGQLRVIITRCQSVHAFSWAILYAWCSTPLKQSLKSDHAMPMLAFQNWTVWNKFARFYRKKPRTLSMQAQHIAVNEALQLNSWALFPVLSTLCIVCKPRPLSLMTVITNTVTRAIQSSEWIEVPKYACTYNALIPVK